MLWGDTHSNRLPGYELPTLKEHLAAADLFVDVGANAGFFTLVASRAGVPVLAIEPSPINLQSLSENIRMAAGPGAVEMLPLALSDREGEVYLLGSGQGASLVTNWRGVRSTYRTRVRAATLDQVLAGRAGSLLIKVDVEGAEDAVLRGAYRTLRRSPRPVWLVEHGPEVEPGYVVLFETFWHAGYQIHALPETPERRPYRVGSWAVDAWQREGFAPDLMFVCVAL